MRKHIHSTESFIAYQQTFQVYPRTWYENSFFSSKILMLIITLPSFWLLAWFKILPNLWISIIGVIVYIVGLIFDVLSTVKVTNLKPKFDKHNYEFPVYESAFLYAAEPRLKDILMHWHFWLTVAAIPVIYIVPTGAFGILVGRLSATFSNLRIAQRLELMINNLPTPSTTSAKPTA